MIIKKEEAVDYSLNFEFQSCIEDLISLHECALILYTIFLEKKVFVKRIGLNYFLHFFSIPLYNCKLQCHILEC